MRQHQLHSHTSQYGTISRSIRYFDLDPMLKAKMQEALEEIRSGAFAKEWSTDREAKIDFIRQAREIQATLPLTQWEDRTRRAFRIGDAAAGGRREPAD
jgi:ketol-acid reductoisomerase